LNEKRTTQFARTEEKRNEEGSANKEVWVRKIRYGRIRSQKKGEKKGIKRSKKAR